MASLNSFNLLHFSITPLSSFLTATQTKVFEL